MTRTTDLYDFPEFTCSKPNWLSRPIPYRYLWVVAIAGGLGLQAWLSSEQTTVTPPQDVLHRDARYPEELRALNNFRPKLTAEFLQQSEPVYVGATDVSLAARANAVKLLSETLHAQGIHVARVERVQWEQLGNSQDSARTRWRLVAHFRDSNGTERVLVWDVFTDGNDVQQDSH